MAYDLADPVPLTVQIRDAAGALANAGAVTVTVTLPDGTTATPAVTNPSVGQYQADYAPTQPGRHTVRWVATGANASGFSDAFDVSAATPDYIISLADARSTLRLTATDQDEDLRGWIEATTAVIERHLNEVVVRRTITEDHRLPRWSSPLHGPRLVLRQRPALSLTSITSLDGQTTWDITGLHLDTDTGVVTPLNGSVAWTGSLQLQFSPFPWGDVTVVYPAGRTVIPAHYQQAARIIIQDLWQTRRGHAGTPPPLGLTDSRRSLRPQGKRSDGYAIPDAALTLLGHPRLNAWAMNG